MSQNLLNVVCWMRGYEKRFRKSGAPRTGFEPVTFSLQVPYSCL